MARAVAAAVAASLLLFMCCAAAVEQLEGQCPANYEAHQQRLVKEPAGSCQDAASGASQGATCDGASSWIVRFKEYLDVGEAHRTLSIAVDGEGEAWRWIDRNNAAAAHPTDFGLVSISPVHLTAVSAKITSLPHVRDMHPDKRYTGKLNWVPEGPLREAMLGLQGGMVQGGGAMRELLGSQPHSAEHSAQEAGEQESQQDDEFDFSVSKRPGRFSTPFMMQGEDEEGEEFWGGSVEEIPEAANTHDRQREKREDTHDRQLLRSRGWAHAAGGSEHDGAAAASGDEQQAAYRHSRRLQARAPITSMLHADKIWEQGFSGKGVKVCH